MIKKAFFASAVCALCFLASCGNKNQEQTTPAEEVVGEEVTTEVQDGDTLEGATGEVEQAVPASAGQEVEKAAAGTENQVQEPATKAAPVK